MCLHVVFQIGWLGMVGFLVWLARNDWFPGLVGFRLVSRFGWFLSGLGWSTGLVGFLWIRLVSAIWLVSLWIRFVSAIWLASRFSFFVWFLDFLLKVKTERKVEGKTEHRR